MRKRPPRVTQGKKRQEVKPARRHAPGSTPCKEARKERIVCNQLKCVFESLPNGVIGCDQAGKILYINAAALKLFEVTPSARWKGTSYQQFLANYELRDEQQRPVSLVLWCMNLASDDGATAGLSEKTPTLHTPSGQRVPINLRCLSVADSCKHGVGIVFVFHRISPRYQKALHLQRVYEAVLTLTNATAHLPEPIAPASPEEPFLLSVPVSFVAQQLVDVIRHVLDCLRVSLLAHEPTGLEYRVASSGLTLEQEEYWQKVKGCLLPTEWVNETVLARLASNQEVVIAGNRLHLPPQFRSAFDATNHLLIPLFQRHQWVGVLAVVKAGQDSEYTSEEIALVKAVATQAMLIIECLCCMYERAEARTRILMQNEICRLSGDFLTLASHELRTPLTGVIGNIQLAQRRLESLKRLLGEQPERVSEKIESVQHPLASASQSAYLQKRMINDIVDYARIQTKQLDLHMNHYDLLTLLKETVAKQQQYVPERRIVLDIPATEQRVPILADAERITQVLNTYLTNALNSSPVEQPVTVRLVVADTVALVSVRDEGPGIPAEDQERLWERFYRAKGSGVQQELDLSLGLGLYLCRALIEYHRGRVGVQSVPGKGETFWFTLPIVGEM